MNDLISKEQMRTILSSLKDYVDSNREENSINIKQTTLYTWDGTTVSSTVDTSTIFMLSDDPRKYDYLVVTFEADDTKRNQSIIYDIANCDFSSFINNYVHHELFQASFYINRDNTPEKCQITLSAKSSYINSIHCKSVVGIKLTKNLDNATSLDETILYSGNDPITATVGSTAYTLSDDITNFDSIIIEVEGNQQRTTDVVKLSATRICSSQVLGDAIVNYNYSIGEHRGDNYTAYFDGWVTCATSEGASTTTIRFALRDKTSNINSVILKSVIGVKKNSLSTADIAEMAMPSDVYINIPATTEYIAPANGYIIVMATASSSNSRVRVVESDWSKGQTGFMPINGWSYGTMMPCIKGHTYIVYANDINLNDLRIRFYYSIGDAKALGLI